MTDATHVYVVFQGDFPDFPAESWQFGIRYKLEKNNVTPDTTGSLPTFSVEPATVSRTEADWTIISNWNAGMGSGDFIHVDDWLNDQLAPAVVDNAADLRFSDKARFTGIKVSPIKSGGGVADLRTSQLTWTSSNPVGNLSVPQLPSECSVVVSWETEVIGRRGRGRIYLPPTAAAVLNDDGQLPSTVTQHIADGAAAFLSESAITSGILANLWALPIVTGGPPWTSFGQIQGCNVGNVIDTQRRRRRQLVETRSHSDVSY